MRRVTLAAFLCLLAPAAAGAQGNELAATAGMFNFDLAGTGNAPMFGATYTRVLAADWLLLEGGVTFAYPEQQVAVVAPDALSVNRRRTTVVVPEVLLLYQWNLGRVRPFFGGGAGAAIELLGDAAGGDDTAMTLAGAAGVKIRLRESSGVRAEVRMRGIGSGFSGSAAELRVGVFRSF